MNNDSSTPLLEVRGLRCERVGRLLFENVDFLLAEGGILQVAGPNGCGKTTMLRTWQGCRSAVPAPSCGVDSRSHARAMNIWVKRFTWGMTRRSSRP